jgi:hypothetical protein
MVTITDPEGFQCHVIYGQERATPTDSQHEKLVANYPNEKSRLRKFNRFESGPAAVHKVCVLCLRPN